MLKAYKYRLYPTDEQKRLINKHFHMTRLIYNMALSIKSWHYETYRGAVNLSFNDITKQIPELKEHFPEFKEVNAQSLCWSIDFLKNAYDNFFKGRGKYPQYKKRSTHNSFTAHQGTSIDWDKKKLKLIKFKEGIDIVLHREFLGTIKRVTVSRNSAHQYFASILVENGVPLPEPVEQTDISNACGIDVGLKQYITLVDGKDNQMDVKYPKYYEKHIKRLSILKRRRSKKKKGSKNSKKALLQINKLETKIVNMRNYFLHKHSKAITDKYDLITIEDLDIKEMTQKIKPIEDGSGHYLPNNRKDQKKHNRSIQDSAWGRFFSQIEYKAKFKGKVVVKADRYFASSKNCSVCGIKNNEMTLDVRVWECDNCGTLHDRDENAAKNLLNEGVRKSGLCKSVEPVEVFSSEAVEAGIPENCSHKNNEKSKTKKSRKRMKVIA